MKDSAKYIEALAEIVSELGWVIAVPTEGEFVPGLIIGEMQFVHDVAKKYYGDQIETFAQDPRMGEMKEVAPVSKPSPEAEMNKIRFPKTNDDDSELH